MIVLFYLLVSVKASSLFLPDSDTAALVALVSNTAGTVTNTLEILEVAKNTSAKIDKYNHMAMRKFFIARRIEQHAREMARINKIRPKNLRELNRAMSRLKFNLRGLKNSIDFLAKDVAAAKDFVDNHWKKMAGAADDQMEAHRQEMASAKGGPLKAHTQNTAMNTAMTAKMLAKIRRDNLEWQNAKMRLDKARAAEELRRNDFYLRWLGMEGDR